MIATGCGWDGMGHIARHLGRGIRIQAITKQRRAKVGRHKHVQRMGWRLGKGGHSNRRYKVHLAAPGRALYIR